MRRKEKKEGEGSLFFCCLVPSNGWSIDSLGPTALEGSVFADKGEDGPRHPQRHPDLYGDGQAFLLLFRCPRQDVRRPLQDLAASAARSGIDLPLSASWRPLNHIFSILDPFRRAQQPFPPSLLTLCDAYMI